MRNRFVTVCDATNSVRWTLSILFDSDTIDDAFVRSLINANMIVVVGFGRAQTHTRTQTLKCLSIELCIKRFWSRKTLHGWYALATEPYLLLTTNWIKMRFASLFFSFSFQIGDTFFAIFVVIQVPFRSKSFAAKLCRQSEVLCAHRIAPATTKKLNEIVSSDRAKIDVFGWKLSFVFFFRSLRKCYVVAAGRI